MDNGAAHELQQPNINRALEPRAQLRWLYYLSLGTLWFLRRSAFSKVYVTNTQITVDGPGGAVEIHFHQLAALTFFRLPYVGGWMTLRMRDGKKFRFSSMIERSDYILDAVAITQPILVSSKQLEEYRRTAIVSDHFYARMELSFSDWRMLGLMQLVLPMMLTMAVCLALNVQETADTFLIFASVGILNGIVTPVVWWIWELAEMMRKSAELVENPLNPLRDLKREKRAKNYSRVAHIAAAALLTYWMWVR